MVEVKAGKVADRVMRLIGLEPMECTMTGAMRIRFEDAVNDAINKIWADQRWLPLMRIEFRRFRPDWDGEQLYLEGHEVWFEGFYWRSVAAGTQAGHAPEENGAFWRKLKGDEVVRMVQFAQPWEESVIDEGGIDLAAFAWSVNPRLNPDAPPIGGCTFWMDSVLLPKSAPDGVWCRFLPKRPQVTFVEFEEGRGYNRGEVCYRTLTGHCYEALLDGVEVTPSGVDAENAGLWRRVLIPDFIVPFVAYSAAGNYMSEEQGKYQTLARANDELEQIRFRFFERSGSAQGMRVDLRRRRR